MRQLFQNADAAKNNNKPKSILHGIRFAVAVHNIIIVVTFFVRVKTQSQSRWNLLPSISGLLFGPCAQPYELLDPCLATSTLAGQNRFIDPRRHGLSERRIKQRRQGWSQVLGREDEKSHGMLKILEKLLVCGSAWCKLRGCKVERGSNVRAGRHTLANKLDELQTKQSKVERGVVVKKLVLRQREDPTVSLD